jgi:hypothetical protein
MRKRVIVLVVICAVLHTIASCGALAPTVIPHLTGRYETIFGVAFFAGFVALLVALLVLLFHRGDWAFRLPMLLSIAAYISLWSVYFWWFLKYAD